jgi:hypothetical protein
VGRNGITFINLALCREAFHGLRVQNVAKFNSDQYFVFCLLGGKKKEKTKERNSQGACFPRARHALLAVPHRILAAVQE